MEYNTDELEAPEWMNAEFMKKVIEQNQQRSDVKVSDYKITPATVRGDHFASIMFRACVQFTTDHESTNQKISLIIKTFPVVEGMKKDILGQIDIFETEIFMYTKVLKDCQEMLKKCGYNDLFVAKLLYCSLEPHKILVFEDLKEMGYFMLEGKPGEHEIRLIYSKLAQFHATTFKLLADGRHDLNLKGTLFRFPMIREMEFYRTCLESVAEALSTIPNFEEHVQQIRELNFDFFLDKCLETIEADSLYKVINHGDYHARNMMFKNNEFGAVGELVLVDFQLPHYGSPVYDLVYMGSILPYEQREGVFRHYFNVFSDVLVKTGYKGDMPTYEQLQQEIKRYAYIDLFIQITIAGFIHLDKTELSDDLDKVLTDKNLKRKVFNSPSYISHMKQAVPKLLALIKCDKNENK